VKGAKFNQQLDSVHYQQPPWSTHYPNLVNIFNDHPCLPVNNTVVDNVYCPTSGGKFTNVSPQQISSWYDKFENNVEKC